jgi:hypothetical protein
MPIGDTSVQANTDDGLFGTTDSGSMPPCASRSEIDTVAYRRQVRSNGMRLELSSS